MSRSFTRLLLCVLLLAGGTAFAQTGAPDSAVVARAQADSSNASLLVEYNAKLATETEQRKEDSIQKEVLEAEIAKLRLTDSNRKKQLQEQLKQLESQKDIRLTQKRAEIAALKSKVVAYPVMGFFKDTLFPVYNRLGSFSAADRADAITSRIRELESNFAVAPDSIRLMHGEITTDLVAGNRIIMSVSEADALWNDVTKEELAQRYKSIIAGAVARYRKETSWMVVAKEIGLALLALGILVAVLLYVSKFFRWTASKIESQEGEKIKGIQIKDYTLFDAHRQVEVLLSVNRFVKWVIILFCIYIVLPIVFNIFPWTQNYAHTLFGYVVNPAKRIAAAVWNYLPNFFTILVIVFIFRYIKKALHFLKNEVQLGHLKMAGFYPDWAAPTYQILRVILYAFMFVLIFPYLPGSDSPVFQGVSVFLGFLFTFGSAGSLSNVMAGLVLTYMRLFKIGDRVKVGDITGDVIEKSLLVTRVRTPYNEIVSIPNSTVMSSHTINYSSEKEEKGLILHTTVTIGYDVPYTEIEGALMKAADRTEAILKAPAPFVLQTSLEDFYVAYELCAYTKETNSQGFVYSAIHRNIQDCCNEVGIEIMSPHYRAARDGNTTTIPASYLPEDYEAPNFRMQGGRRVPPAGKHPPKNESGKKTAD